VKVCDLVGDYDQFGNGVLVFGDIDQAGRSIKRAKNTGAETDATNLQVIVLESGCNQGRSTPVTVRRRESSRVTFTGLSPDFKPCVHDLVISSQ